MVISDFDGSFLNRVSGGWDCSVDVMEILNHLISGINHRVERYG